MWSRALIHLLSHHFISIPHLEGWQLILPPRQVAQTPIFPKVLCQVNSIFPLKSHVLGSWGKESLPLVMERTEKPHCKNVDSEKGRDWGYFVIKHRSQSMDLEVCCATHIHQVAHKCCYVKGNKATLSNTLFFFNPI